MAEGWGWPGISRRAHYFVGGMSLCGRWLYAGEVWQGKDESPDNCHACMRKLKERQTTSRGQQAVLRMIKRPKANDEKASETR